MNKQQVIENLSKLNIRSEGEFNSRGWLSILCPHHNDKNFGNAFISENSVIKCFSCGVVSNLFTVVKQKYSNYSNKQIFEFLGSEQVQKLELLLSGRISQKLQQEKIKEIFQFNFNSLKTIDVDLELYYCKTRNFTTEWIDKFQVKTVTTGYYKDYFVVPIYYQRKVINYEFRKAYEMEYFKQLFPNCRGTLEDFRKKSIDSTNLTEITTYLKKPKVLYPRGNSSHKNIIFNIDNLDYTKDIYICEGVAGTAEIYNQGLTNVTALFGSEISDKQLDIISQFQGKKYLIYDNDEASEKLAWKLNSKIENCYIFDKNQPISEYLITKSEILNMKIV